MEEQRGSESNQTSPKTDYSKNILSPKNILMYLVAATIVYAGIYYFFVKKGNFKAIIPSESPVLDEPVATGGAIINNQMLVELKAQNGSGEDGVAILTEEDGKTKIEINIASTVEDAQPAHIHIGSCPAPGVVKFPLENIVKGASQTTIAISLADLAKMMPLAINIHKSTTDLKTNISCGDVK